MSKGKTNPIGPGTKNLNVNVPERLHADLSALAEASGMKVSAYVRKVLAEAVEDGLVYETVTQRARLDRLREERVAEDPSKKNQEGRG